MRMTRWHVITGAPCSGKTTVIRDLERRGFRVVHETARAWIEEELQKGRTMAEIRSDPLRFQQTVLYRKLDVEKNLPDDEIVFFDRGMPDSIAYYRLAGLDTTQPLEFSEAVRYKRVFFLEPLPFRTDRVRTEDPETAARIDQFLRDAYELLGYDIIPVPVLDSPEKRTELILAHINA